VLTNGYLPHPTRSARDGGHLQPLPKPSLSSPQAQACIRPSPYDRRQRYGFLTGGFRVELTKCLASALACRGHSCLARPTGLQTKAPSAPGDMTRLRTLRSTDSHGTAALAPADLTLISVRTKSSKCSPSDIAKLEGGSKAYCDRQLPLLSEATQRNQAAAVK
jgi:hypothetical protein